MSSLSHKHNPALLALSANEVGAKIAALGVAYEVSLYLEVNISIFLCF